MDKYVKIIRGVKKYPQLYKRFSKVEDRAKIWLILSLQLELDEEYLRRTWHILREQYVLEQQRLLQTGQSQYPLQTHFKYTKEMSFLKEHVNIQLNVAMKDDNDATLSWITPEFVITEADLVSKADNDLKLIFVEPVEKSEGRKEMHTESTVVVEGEVPAEIYELETHHPEEILPDDQTADANIINIEQTARTLLYNNTKQKVVVEKISVKHKGLLEEHAPGELKSSAEAMLRKASKIEFSDELTAKKARCEDLLFGKLVTSMLTQMDPSKKKIMKKDIMNLLLA